MIRWLFALLLVLLMTLATSGARAAEPSRPFELKCPDVLKCQKNEQGQWVPNWQVRSLAAELAELHGKAEQLQRADEQRTALEKSIRAYDNQIETLHLRILECDAARRAQQALENKVTRRTRWAIASTVIAVVAIGALSAGIYVAGH